MGISLSAHSTECLKHELVDFTDDILERRVSKIEDILEFLRYVNSLKNIDWDDIQAQYHSLVASIFKKSRQYRKRI